MLFAHVKCDSSGWQGSTPCPARGFLMISGLVTHFSTYPSAVGKPAQSPIPLPAQDTGHLAQGWTMQSSIYGPQATDCLLCDS